MRTSSDLGSRINRARKGSGVSVSQLAERLGVSRGVASDILTGKRSPSPWIARRLIDMLEFDDQTRDELLLITEARYMSSALDGSLVVDSYEEP